ncbi:hypothetical protein [Halomonas sp. I5-271120]|uniref:hypothetical protein n=1 Tax=Halomonas sp. I5-271120 TaxID=3061632 RepID=UPI002714C708|nr:hypothetical protein [Halomonas sp. I5-271120]
MSHSVLSDATKLGWRSAPGVEIHELIDGGCWAVSQTGLFTPIYLGNVHDVPELVLCPPMVAVKAVRRVCNISPVITEALADLDPHDTQGFTPAPGYSVVPAPRKDGVLSREWFVEDTHGTYIASVNFASAWEACVAAVAHHEASTPEPRRMIEVAQELIEDVDYVELADSPIVNRDSANAGREAYVQAWVRVSDDFTIRSRDLKAICD